MIRARVPAFTALMLTLFAVGGCASRPTGQAVRESSHQPGTDGGISIIWDRPIPDGTVVSTIDEAVQVGKLTFTPLLPNFGVLPVSIEVADPTEFQATAFMYNFPLSAEFPTDGHVRVLESKALISQQALLNVVSNPPGPAEDFKVVQIAGQDALLVQGNGVGRVQFIRDGIQFDVTGPEISPEECERLASQL